jgi:hypothetical protein
VFSNPVPKKRTGHCIYFSEKEALHRTGSCHRSKLDIKIRKAKEGFFLPLFQSSEMTESEE